MEKVQDRESMGTLEILDAMGTQNMFDFANTLNHVKSFSNDPRKNKAIKNLIKMLIERIKVLLPFERWSHIKGRSAILQRIVKDEKKVDLNEYSPGKDPQCVEIMKALCKELGIPDWAVSYDPTLMKFVPNEELIKDYRRLSPQLNKEQIQNLTINERRNFVLDGREYKKMDYEEFLEFAEFKDKYIQEKGNEYYLASEEGPIRMFYYDVDKNYHTEDGSFHFINMDTPLYKEFLKIKSPELSKEVEEKAEKISEAFSEDIEMDKKEGKKEELPIPKPKDQSPELKRIYNDMVHQREIAHAAIENPENLPYMKARVTAGKSLIAPYKEEDRELFIQLPSKKPVLNEIGEKSTQYNTDFNHILFSIDRELVSFIAKDGTSKSGARISLPMDESVPIYDMYKNPILDETGAHVHLPLYEVASKFQINMLDVSKDILLTNADSLTIVEKDGISYGVDKDNTHAMVLGYEGNSKDIKISPTVELEGGVSVPVLEIAPFAFQSQKIESISIPESVEKIGERAFERCYLLKDVSFEANTLKSVGDFAFEDCSSLAFVSLPGSVLQIGNNPFIGCSRLETVSVLTTNNEEEPSPLHVNDNGLLLYEDRLVSIPYASIDKAIMISEDVSSVGAYALYNSDVESVTFLGNLTEIEDFAFGSCTSLEEVCTPVSERVAVSDMAFANSSIDLKGLDFKNLVLSNERPLAHTAIERELNKQDPPFRMEINAEPVSPVQKQPLLISRENFLDLAQSKFGESSCSLSDDNVLLVSNGDSVRQYGLASDREISLLKEIAEEPHFVSLDKKMNAVDLCEHKRLHKIEQNFETLLPSLLDRNRDAIDQKLNGMDFAFEAIGKYEDIDVDRGNIDKYFELAALMSLIESEEAEIVGVELDGDEVHIATHQSLCVSKSCFLSLLGVSMEGLSVSNVPQIAQSSSHTKDIAKDVPDDIQYKKEKQEQEQSKEIEQEQDTPPRKEERTHKKHVLSEGIDFGR